MKIIKHDSPNHFIGRNGWKSDIIVSHQSGTIDLASALSWYLRKGSDCSPHFVIDVNGDIHHLVDLDNGAWCNGTGVNPNQKLYYGKSTSRLVQERKTNANYYTYSIEFVHCRYGNITEAQITAAIELIKNIIIPHMKKNGVTPQIDRDHLIGHCEIDPVGRAFCPGKQFPYERIINGVLGKVATTTTAVAKPQEKPAETTNPKVGDKVKVKNGAKTYTGTSLAAFVYGQVYDVMEVKGDRVVIGQKRKVTAAVRAEDLVRI